MGRTAHKVVAKDSAENVLAEYLFATGAEADLFAEGCKEKGLKVTQDTMNIDLEPETA
jgi:hypothetical protein|tara:strand:- start:874 stop:1047 length:174 start_codon:yes stop_codon:yes gene_type:complete